MKKALLLASFCASLATTAGAQAASSTPPSADSRAADLDRMMNIRNWQTGPSSGDAASKSDATAQGSSAEQRASDLQKMMEIRSWQTGPSSGDAASKAAAQAPQAGAALDFSKPAVQDGLRTEATP